MSIHISSRITSAVRRLASSPCRHRRHASPPVYVTAGRMCLPCAPAGRRGHTTTRARRHTQRKGASAWPLPPPARANPAARACPQIPPATPFATPPTPALLPHSIPIPSSLSHLLLPSPPAGSDQRASVSGRVGWFNRIRRLCRSKALSGPSIHGRVRAREDDPIRSHPSHPSHREDGVGRPAGETGRYSSLYVASPGGPWIGWSLPPPREEQEQGTQALHARAPAPARHGDGVLAGVPGDERRPRVRGRRGGRHGRRAGGPPARHAPHPPPAAAAAAQPRDRRRAQPPALRRAPPPRHPPRRGPRRALPRHGRAPRLRRVPECDGVPSLRDPVAVVRSRELHLRAPFLRERCPRRRRHGCAANAHPVPRRARQDQAPAGGGGAQAPAARRPPRPRRHGPGHPPAGRAPRHLPRAHGDRAPRRAGARHLLLDVRVRPGAPAPGLPARRRRDPGDDAGVRRARRRRQLGLLLPAGRGEVAAAGAGGVPGRRQVPRRRGLLPEERPGGGAPRAVARAGHRRGAGVRRQRRHLLGVRARSAVLGQRQRPEDGHGGELK